MLDISKGVVTNGTVDRPWWECIELYSRALSAGKVSTVSELFSTLPSYKRPTKWECRMPPLSARWPPLCFFLYPPRCRQPGFPFNSRSKTRNYARSSTTHVQRNQQGNKLQIKGDMGLLQGSCPRLHCISKMHLDMLNTLYPPGTFVMPTGPRKPSLLRSPKLRMRLEWYRLKKKYESLGMWVSLQRITHTPSTPV